MDELQFSINKVSDKTIKFIDFWINLKTITDYK